MAAIRITPNLSIEERDLEVEFVRSSGPGGQNVNKVATAVQLWFDLGNSGLPSGVKDRVRKQAGSRLTSGDKVLISARRHRTQERNRQDAIARLTDLIRDAATPPKPRRKTRRTKGSVERRLQAKKQRSDTKRLRRGPEH